MESGRIRTDATIENLKDLWAVRRGLMTPEQARRIDVPDALVDPRATPLCLPTSLIQQLGLTRVGTRLITRSSGPDETGVYGAVRMTIMGRSCTLDVIEVPDGNPVLIGQIPLGSLDFVVDPVRCELIGNPAHGGEHVIEMY